MILTHSNSPLCPLHAGQNGLSLFFEHTCVFLPLGLCTGLALGLELDCKPYIRAEIMFGLVWLYIPKHLT